MPKWRTLGGMRVESALRVTKLILAVTGSVAINMNRDEEITGVNWSEFDAIDKLCKEERCRRYDGSMAVK